MGFADISSRDAVLEAIRECDRLGEPQFLEAYGFGPSRHVRLFHDGGDYPAKAILGVAHRYEFPDQGPLSPREFTSGDSTIRKFGQLGFTARSVEEAGAPRLFVVRGGRDEEVVGYALQNSVAATGWSDLGDLSRLNDDDIDAAMADAYPDVAAESLSRWKVAVRAFKELRVDDLVILPITSQDQFAVGVVTGGYEHRPDNHELAANCYPVRWLATDLPRDLLGDLRTRVDLPPAVHRIGVPDAVSLVERMLESREPVTLRQPGATQSLSELLESRKTAVAAKDHEAIKQIVGGRAPKVVADLLGARHPISSGTGQATPAEVPWISVYPPDAPASAQQGIYAVYLFAADGSAVYLSFMQGTENVAGGLPPLRKRALDMRRAAGLDQGGDPIHLASQATRPRKYEAGSAYAVRYGRGDVPADDVLHDDLVAVLGYVTAALDAGLEFDPQREPTHLLFKWSADLEPSTIEQHRAIADRRGHTWWGRFGAKPMEPTKLAMLQGQLNDGVETHVYLYGGKTLFRARLIELTTDPAKVAEEDKPSYFATSDCSMFARVRDFEELEPSWARENLLLSSDPDPDKVPGALSNQTTPLLVFERFVSAEGAQTPVSELDMQWLQAQTLWPTDTLQELLDALDPGTGKGQVILAGPPGTGKTWVAERVARFLTQDQPLKRRTVQFHPSYGYEEFVEGIRPTAQDGGISFEPVKGTVLKMVDGMDGTDDAHVLVIDELNRANIPRVFGELLYLLEYRDQEIELQHSASFQLPSNLRIVATMNTADRSVRSIDVALRRRFEVFECPADPDVLERFYAMPGHTTSVDGLIEGFATLNSDLTALLDRHHTIGQSFFMAKHYDRERLERTWRRQIMPLIEDYFFDQPDVVGEFTIDKYWPLVA